MQFNHFTVDTITRLHTAVPFHLIPADIPFKVLGLYSPNDKTFYHNISRITRYNDKTSYREGSVLCDYEISEARGFGSVMKRAYCRFHTLDESLS